MAETKKVLYFESFLKAMAIGKIKVNVCKLNARTDEILSIEDNEILPKNSESPSLSFFANIALRALGKQDLPISVKLFIDPGASLNTSGDYALQGLKYECLVYQYVTEKIILPKLSPNFISLIGFGCCNAPEDGVYYVENPDNKKLCILATERAGNGGAFGQPGMHPVTSLQSFVSEMDMEDEVKNSILEEILFQVVYSLEVMQKMRMVHNDLHPGNVLVMELPMPVAMQFKVGNVLYELETQYIPQLFDWDIGYVESIGDNPKLEEKIFKKNFNIRNRFTTKSDLYTLVCSLRHPGYSLYQEAQQKEANQYIILTKKEYDTINKFEPYFTSAGKTYYKMSGNQIRDIITQPDVISKELNSAIFYVDQFQNGDYGLVWHYAFDCRPTNMSSDFPTPAEFLEYGMDQYRVSMERLGSTPYVYTMPTVSEKSAIYIDPFYAEKGRKKLVEAGITPRFPPASTGYVNP